MERFFVRNIINLFRLNACKFLDVKAFIPSGHGMPTAIHPKNRILTALN